MCIPFKFIGRRPTSFTNSSFALQLRLFFSSLTPGLVEPAPADVPDPFDDVVVGVVELGLEDLEVAHLEAGGRERDLKVHGDWRPGPLLLAVSLQEFDLRGNLGLFHTGHALDPVMYHILVILCSGHYQ